MRGNYYEIAIGDLYFAKVGLSTELDDNVRGYNTCAASCTQAAEKFLKYLFITFDVPFEENMIKSHNLNSLLKELQKTFSETKTLVSACRFLNDFYIDSKYPGDNFEWVDLETAKKCLSYVQEVKECVDGILQNPLYEQKLFEALKHKFDKK